MYSKFMQTTPRTAAGQRLMARAPKANMVKVAAYEASEKAIVDKWLAFEAEYYLSLEEEVAGLY